MNIAFYKGVSSGQIRVHGLVIIAITCLFVFIQGASGIILHPDGEPNMETWVDRPHQRLVGRWDQNASCAVVSSNCVVTTRHQGYDIDTTVVWVGDDSYSLAEVWEHSTADLMVARLYGANLSRYASLFTGTNELFQDTVLGGYGMGRGELLDNYGYVWDGGGNTVLRWGQNRVEGFYVASGGGFTSDVMWADFDDIGVPTARQYEVTAAMWDSGGGWFIKEDDQWKLAALSRAVTDHGGQSWYLPPDTVDGVRISSYALWISQTIPARLAGDLTGDQIIDLLDFALFADQWTRDDCDLDNNDCQGADMEPADGVVDFNDLAVITDGWLTGLE